MSKARIAYRRVGFVLLLATGVLQGEAVPAASCGNGIIEGTELCDTGSVLQSCSMLGFEGGVLGCAPDCLGLDTAECIDLTPPAVVSVIAVGSRLKVTFSEPPDPGSPATTDPLSYSISGGVATNDVTIADDGNTVVLRTSSHTEGLYLLTVSGVSDARGNARARQVFPYHYVPVVFPGSSWESRSPEEVGLDSTKLDQLVADLGSAGFIARDGYVVRQWNSATRVDWGSAHKPAISTLLMFAAHEGLISGIDEAVDPYVQLTYGQGLEPKDLPMTFRDLANMTSGYAREEPPSEAWAYNDVAIGLLRSTLTLGVYGESNVNVIAASPVRLGSLQFEDGNFFKGTGRVETSPRDFARLGWWWANDGRWNQLQLLPESMFDDLWRPQVPGTLPRSTNGYVSGDYLNAGNGGTNQTALGPGIYGMAAWFNPDRSAWPSAPADTFQANGHWNREVVTVIPSLRMVAAWIGDPGHPSSFTGEMDVLLEGLIDAVLPACLDDDADGFCVQNDCDDANASVFPGAPEELDGLDNQCPSDEGYGVTDEFWGDAVFAKSGGTDWLCWQSQAGATGYEVARSSSPAFVADCSISQTGDTCLETDDAVPTAGNRLFYLVRALDDGMWGQTADGVERDPMGSCPGPGP